MSSTPRGSQENGMKTGLCSAGGRRKTGVRASFLSPRRRKTSHQQRISGEFYKETFRKLGELETHNTYPSGSHIQYVSRLRNPSARRTARAPLLTLSPHPQGGKDKGQLVTGLAARAFGKRQGCSRKKATNAVH